MIIFLVLHLGNIFFHHRQSNNGPLSAEIGSHNEIKWISHLLNIKSAGLEQALTTKITVCLKLFLFMK